MYGEQSELMHVSIGQHASTDYYRWICRRVIKNYPGDPGPFVERVELTLWDRGSRDNALSHLVHKRNWCWFDGAEEGGLNQYHNWRWLRIANVTATVKWPANIPAEVQKNNIISAVAAEFRNTARKLNRHNTQVVHYTEPRRTQATSTSFYSSLDDEPAYCGATVHATYHEYYDSISRIVCSLHRLVVLAITPQIDIAFTNIPSLLYTYMYALEIHYHRRTLTTEWHLQLKNGNI
ncbi:hypothetical protein CBL_11435 [Carabus blaptoides fortunei]